MKGYKVFLVVLMVLLSVALVVTEAPAAEKETVWKFSMFDAEGTPYYNAYKAMFDKINERTDGELKINIYPLGQLGGERDLLQNLQTGALEGAQTGASIFSLVEPIYLIVNLPFIFDDYDHALRFVKTPEGQEMMKKIEDQGLYIMHWCILGYRQPNLVKKLIKQPEDFVGVKWRTMEVATQIDTMKALGAIPIPLPYPEVYNSLKMGVVDAWMNDAIAFKNLGTPEVAPYFTEIPLFASTQACTFSKKAFDALSEKNQKIVREIVAEDIEAVIKAAWDQNYKELQDLKDNAFKEWNKITDTASYLEKVQVVYDDLIAKHPETKKYIDAVNRVR